MKRAVLLAAMGGPSCLKEVRPFLSRLFMDPAIIRYPLPIRFILASLISFLREKEAKEIYKKIGGCSPILPNTQVQARALDKALKKNGDYRCFVGMSYSAPQLSSVWKDIKAFDPQEVIILPMYPQFSTTTTASVISECQRAATKNGIKSSVFVIEHFYDDPGFIAAFVDHMKEAKKSVPNGNPIRWLFSAHGLPEKIVQHGDPYPQQCAKTVQAILRELPVEDYVLCYQSRVGPLKWIGPSIDQEIKRAGKEGKAIIVVPISFVCEHSETLVELKMHYREEAQKQGAPFYRVVETPMTHPAFIKGLAQRVLEINQNMR